MLSKNTYTDIIKTPSYNLQENENIPAVISKFRNKIRNNILNYIYAVDAIYADGEVSFSLHTDFCDCDKHNNNKHYKLNYLRITENSELIELLTKAPTDRKHRSSIRNLHQKNSHKNILVRLGRSKRKKIVSNPNKLNQCLAILVSKHT